MIKRQTASKGLGVFLLAFFFISIFYLSASTEALACGADSSGWGKAGGDGFTSQKNTQSLSYGKRRLLTLDQANEIIERHLAGLNPNLKVGGGRDAGRYYKFQVLINDRKVEQLAVDKTTGLIRSVN
jgi:hypothetical protein